MQILQIRQRRRAVPFIYPTRPPSGSCCSYSLIFLLPVFVLSLSSLPVARLTLLSAFGISETTRLHFLTLLISLYHLLEPHTYYMRYPA